MPARSAAEYLAGLADQREIWFDGNRVESVVGHPILGRMARTLAALYDLQRDAALQAKLTYPSPTTGDAVSLAFIQPRSIEELMRRRAMFKHWADFSGGMLGRTPDYLNALLAGCASSEPYFARNGPEYARRIVSYERFFAGDPFILMASRFTSYDRSEVVARVKALLARSAAAKTEK